MSDDLVKELREGKFIGEDTHTWAWCREAADEIEELRDDRRWLLHHIAMLNCGCPLCKDMVETNKPYLELLKGCEYDR